MGGWGFLLNKILKINLHGDFVTVSPHVVGGHVYVFFFVCFVCFFFLKFGIDELSSLNILIVVRRCFTI